MVYRKSDEANLKDTWSKSSQGTIPKNPMHIQTQIDQHINFICEHNNELQY